MKVFNVLQNIGKAKYIVNFHNGVKTHADGSMFFDIQIFKNKKEFQKFQDQLQKDGYSYLT